MHGPKRIGEIVPVSQRLPGYADPLLFRRPQRAGTVETRSVLPVLLLLAPLFLQTEGVHSHRLLILLRIADIVLLMR